MLRAISLSACAFTFVVALQFSAPGTADEAGVSQVVEQARFWEKRNRYDLANQAWEKVLLSDPDNTDALTALGAAAAYAGDKSLANSYADRLRKVNPNHGGIKVINEALGQPVPEARDPDRTETASGQTESALARARRLANNQQKSQAIGEYRRHFGGRAPNGDLALEFYQTLGGTPGGWEEARAGLERIAKESPQNYRYQLAYAEHLTYREGTRREGIKKLAELEKQSAVSATARKSRRQALVWLDARTADYGLYQDYLKDHPDDGAVQNRFAQVKRDFPRGGPRKAEPYQMTQADIMVRDGFAALDSGKLGEAESIFKDLLQKQPENSNALGGLGIVALQRGEFDRSVKFLERASAARPSAAGRWRSALASAKTWSDVEQAEAARQAGDPEAALVPFERALNRSPNELAVRSTYADTLAEAGRPEAALAQYDRVLQAEPKNVGALKGKIYALSSLGRTDEALKLAEQIPEGQREQIAGLNSLKGYALRSSASNALEAGDAKRAEYLLQQAIEADPNNPFSQILLADLYRQTDRPDQSRQVLNSLSVEADSSPDALYIRALLQADESRWLEGLRTLERVPPESRTRDMHALQKRLWMRYEAQRAEILARRGDVDGAAAALDRIRSVAEPNSETLGILAAGYSDIGQKQRAEELLRRAMREQGDPDPSIRLQYAGLLSERGQEARFREQLAILRNQYDNLSVSERNALEQLEGGFAIKRADALREQGRLADAYEFLRPHLAANPNDADLNMALARLYVDFDEPVDGLDLYYDVIERDRNNLKAYEGAIAAATEAGKYDEAEWMVKRAIEQDPNNPRFYVLAGRMEQAKGNDRRAASLFKQALALDSMRMSDGLGPVGSPEQFRSVPADNPFGQPSYPGPQASARSTSADDQRYAFRRSSAQMGPEAESYARAAYLPQASRRNVDQVAQRSIADLTRPQPAPQQVAQLYDDPQAYEPATPRSRNPASERGQLIDQIANLESERSSWLAGGLFMRYRDGQDGLGELTDIEVPFEFSLGEAGPGRARFRVIPVALDSGRVSGFDAPNFGALPLAEAVNGTGSAASIAASNSQYDQSDNGVALGFVYELGDLRFDVGSTPLGFQEEDIVGGVRWTPTFDDVLLSVDLSRRSVTDSLLSYAGTRDPYLDGLSGSEVSFGGVTRNGVRVDIAKDFGVNGVYANLGGYFIEGELVEDNLNFELGGGYYHHLLSRENSQLTVGVNVTTLFYEENLGEFTVGHGGYFSPQFYTSIGLPIEWVGRHDRLAYRIGGSIGLQAFDEDDADIFPGNFGSLQDRLEAVGGINGRTTYEGSDSTGANIGFHAAAEYLLTPHFSIGGRTTFSNARDYDELGAGAYLRYWFRPQAPESMPRPRVLAPFYPGDPSW